jgi:hypothetical protein
MLDRCAPHKVGMLVVAFLLVPPSAEAQPTYKFDVKPDLKPRATLALDGNRVVRTAVTDDPGFRLQYHFKKDGKTLATPEARAETRVVAPVKEPGAYTVVLELSHPAYKGGTAQKGEFKPVSNVLTFRVEAGKPGEPMRFVLVENPTPAAPPRP